MAPLYGYGNYFVYVIDAPQYSGLPQGQQWNVGEALSLFRANYTGTGRFEASIGVVGSSAGLFQYQVGPQEGETTLDNGALNQIVLRSQIQF